MKTSTFDNLFGYFLTFTAIFQSSDNMLLRHANILNLQSNHSLLLPEKDDILVGRLSPLPISFNPQVTDGCPYQFHADDMELLLSRHSNSMSTQQLAQVMDAFNFWKKALSDPLNHMQNQSADPPHSFRAILPDTDILLSEGLHYIKEITEESSDPLFLKQAKLTTIATLNQVLDFYKYHVCALMTKYPNSRNINACFDILNWIKYRPPRTLHAKIQLYWLYAAVSRCSDAQIVSELQKIYSESADRSTAAQTIWSQVQKLKGCRM